MTAWYVKPLRLLGAAVQFLVDVKIGLDLGRTMDESIHVAWSIWGWRT